MALPGITAVTNLNALESLLLGRGTSGSSALATLVGQDLELLLQAAGPEGVQLQLPSGQSILAQASDKRSEMTYKDAEATFHEAQQIQAHLQAQDDAINAVLDRLEKLEAALTK